MRPTVVVLALLLVLGLAAPALAKHTVLVPPGNSGASQYVETVPTAGGGRPSGSIHPGGPGSGATGKGGPISPATLRQLNAQGPAGRAAAALAEATAPNHPQPAASGHVDATAPGDAEPAAAARVARQSPVAAGGGASPASSVVKALTGSSGTGGLGLLLPILLIATLFGVTLIAVLRRRTTS
jgi:hypothetical protein